MNVRVTFRTPAGLGFADVSVSVFEVPSFVSGWWQYDVPQIFSLAPSKVRAAGSSWVTIIGQNFGRLQVHQRVLLECRASGESSRPFFLQDEVAVNVHASDGVAACTAIVYVADHELLCQVPTKHAENATVVVQVAGQSSVRSDNASLKYFDIPSIYDCWPGDLQCMDCCEHHCTIEKMRARTATGQTAFECKKVSP